MTKPREISQAEVTGQLRSLRVETGGVLLVHTSFRAVRPVEGGPRREWSPRCDPPSAPQARLHALGQMGHRVRPRRTIPWYVDILRNENPVYTYVDSDNPNVNALKREGPPRSTGAGLRASSNQPSIYRAVT